MKTLVAFDLDGTLAPSKSAIDGETAALLCGLLDVVRVAVISGGGFPQFEQQLLARFPQDARFGNLSLLPTCGTTFYQYGDGWHTLYAENLSDAQKREIVNALERAVVQAGFKVDRTWGPQIEDRGSQITYSALGQQAPLDAKSAWDPDFSKRRAVKTLLDAAIPEFSVQMGGTTSIDVTLPGIDKAFGIRKLRDVLHIPISEMLYVGDALFPGGNDYPVRSTGADCIAVRDPDETKRVIEAVIACSKSGT